MGGRRDLDRANNDEGIRVLVERMQEISPTIIAIEATGGWKCLLLRGWDALVCLWLW